MALALARRDTHHMLLFGFHFLPPTSITPKKENSGDLIYARIVETRTEKKVTAGTVTN